MSSSLGILQDNVRNLLNRAEAAGISLKPSGSRFSEKLYSSIELSSENTALVKEIVAALEGTLNRSHDDTRLVLSLCCTLQEFSGLAMPELLKKVEKAIKFLEKPASATVLRTIKTSAAAALHPKVIELQDLDAITALSKAPQNSVSRVFGEQEVLRVGSEAINLATSGKREIEAAVRKVKSEAKKSSAARQPSAPAKDDSLEAHSTVQTVATRGTDTDFEEDELTISDELHSDLDEASLALSKLLRSMPRSGKLSNLTQVIEEAKRLLEFTRRDLAFSRQQDESIDPVYGDLN